MFTAPDCRFPQGFDTLCTERENNRVHLKHVFCVLLTEINNLTGSPILIFQSSPDFSGTAYTSFSYTTAKFKKYRFRIKLQEM